MLRVYGSLPEDLKAAETVEMFNTKLKTFLFLARLVKVFVSVLFILIFIYFDFDFIIFIILYIYPLLIFFFSV